MSPRFRIWTTRSQNHKKTIPVIRFLKTNPNRLKQKRITTKRRLMNSETTDSKVLTLEKHIMSTVKQSSPILKHSKLPNTNLVTSFGLNILVTKLFYSRNYYSHPKTNTIYFFSSFFSNLFFRPEKKLLLIEWKLQL